jgi:hypothetical protein
MIKLVRNMVKGSKGYAGEQARKYFLRHRGFNQKVIKGQISACSHNNKLFQDQRDWNQYFFHYSFLLP